MIFPTDVMTASLYVVPVIIWLILPLVVQTKVLMASPKNRKNYLLNFICTVLVIPYILILLLIIVLNAITCFKLENQLEPIYTYIAKLVFP